MKELIAPLTIESLIDRLNYNAKTGEFTWKPFAVADERYGWNKRYANKPAGYVNRNGYLVITILPYKLLAHRIAWPISYGEWPDHLLDHKDGNRSNNRLSNLRPCSYTQNMVNRKSITRKVDLPRGVSSAGRRYRATVKLDGKRIWTALFDCPNEAHVAYINVINDLHGEFAYTARYKDGAS